MSFFPRTTRPSVLRRSFWFLPEIIALFFVAPLVWFASDRDPPLILSDGTIEPRQVKAGGFASVTWHVHQKRDCPGTTQRELIDAKHNLWPQLTRARRGQFHASSSDDPHTGVLTTPPLAIPDAMSPGPAIYRVTNFYYCNFLQHLLNWPIESNNPEITFEVLPK